MSMNGIARSMRTQLKQQAKGVASYLDVIEKAAVTHGGWLAEQQLDLNEQILARENYQR